MPDEPVSSPPPQLGYERPAGITRGGFRLLILLTFINTILLGVNLMGPQTWQAVRGAYTSFKDRRAKAAAAEQRERLQRAGLKAAVAFRFPENHVAYTEAPEEAMTLMSRGTAYQTIQANTHNAPPRSWQAPVLASPPPALAQHEPIGASGLLFVHERKSPNGTPFLVLVAIRATYQFDSDTTILAQNTIEETKYRLSRHRRLQSVAFKAEPNGDVTAVREYNLDLILPDVQPIVIGTVRQPRYSPAPPTTSPMAPTHQLRVFGGSPDDADPSHFTIPYELDGQPGVIDGWLHDDSLLLRPRQGQAIPSSQTPAWELMPTTRPAGP